LVVPSRVEMADNSSKVAQRLAIPHPPIDSPFGVLRESFPRSRLGQHSSRLTRRISCQHARSPVFSGLRDPSTQILRFFALRSSLSWVQPLRLDGCLPLRETRSDCADRR
jgi:hypothetical protein